MTTPHRRVTVRKRAELDLRFGSGEERTAGRSQNLSLGGAFIHTQGEITFGEELEIFIRFPGFTETRCLPAIVRWAGENGMGVQFGSLDAHTTYELTEYLAHCEDEA
jgi:hypothetical protein